MPGLADFFGRGLNPLQHQLAPRLEVRESEEGRRATNPSLSMVRDHLVKRLPEADERAIQAMPLPFVLDGPPLAGS